MFHVHPITGQKLLYISYWDAGLPGIDVSNPPDVADPLGFHGLKTNEVGRWLGVLQLMMVGMTLKLEVMQT